MAFAKFDGWNENSRLDLTRAIVDEQRFEIDSYFNNTGDRAYYNGHYYSDKAPGMSFFAVPIYFVYKSLFGQVDYKNNLYEMNDSRIFLGLVFSVIALTSALFSALTIVLFYKLSKYFTKNEKIRLISSFILGFCTIVFHYAGMFFGHTTGMFFSFACFYFVFKTKKEGKDYSLLAGILGGVAVLIEYPTFVIVLLTSFLLKRKSFLLKYFSGVLLIVLILLSYNYSIFNNPFDFGHMYVDKYFDAHGPKIHYGGSTSILSFFMKYANRLSSNFYAFFIILIRLLFYPYRGLFFYMPVLIFSFAGLIYMFRNYRLESLIILTSFFILLIINSVIPFWWGGSSFGPRHLIPIMPFLMISLIFSFKKFDNKLVISLALISLFIMLLGMQPFEDIISQRGGSVAEMFQKIVEKYAYNFYHLLPLENPLISHYWPLFIKYGPRSLLIEKLFGFAFPPFLNVSILIVIIVVIWSKEILKIHRH
jgi:hypothetical protein